MSEQNSMIPFTKASYTSLEETSVLEAIRSGRLEGDGPATKKIHQFFESKYGFRKTLFTTSCTDALELAALLLDIQPGDEVIVPSYTFVSSAHAFALRGAKIIFVDSLADHPNLDLDDVEKRITSKTKVVVPVHYAGMACDMNRLMQLSQKHGFYVVEDAAQCVDAFYDSKPAGSFGHLSAFSFHQTKNVSAGEGGLLAINDPKFIHRAEILREKGTNRSAFFRGEVDKYTCVDIGSSFLASDLNAALLLAQLQRLSEIQEKRLRIWNRYNQELQNIPATLPRFDVSKVRHNAHCFYLVCRSLQERTALIAHLNAHQISAPFHYVSLHRSPFYSKQGPQRELSNADRYTDCLVRLPLFAELTDKDQTRIIETVRNFDWKQQ
jgi:dTDP-4-amino-4,6-dideoxygalactose transaminase